MTSIETDNTADGTERWPFTKYPALFSKLNLYLFVRLVISNMIMTSN